MLGGDEVSGGQGAAKLAGGAAVHAHVVAVPVEEVAVEVSGEQGAGEVAGAEVDSSCRRRHSSSTGRPLGLPESLPGLATV